MLESQGKVRWAMPFHVVALAALVGALDVMALRGGLLELVGLGGVAGPARLPYLGFAAAGVVFGVVSLALERARSFDLRRAARFLRVLAALHLVGALGWNALVQGEARDLAALGGAAALLAVLGTFVRHHVLLLAAGAALVLALCVAAVAGTAPVLPYALTLAGAGLLGGIGLHVFLSRGGRA
jgi:hypothetical protein